MNINTKPKTFPYTDKYGNNYYVTINQWDNKIYTKDLKILHREDGPAKEYSEYKHHNEYWLNGKRYTKKQWKLEVSMRPEERIIKNLIE